MAYTILPSGAAPYAWQAEIFQADLDIIANAAAGTGVATGCDVTTVSAMQINVAAGSVTSNGGVRVAVGSTNLTLASSDATNPRIDLIKATPAGVASAVTGSPDSSPQCPALPSGDIGLAFVSVPATVSTITSQMIVDKRMLMPAGDVRIIRAVFDGGGALLPTGARKAYVNVPFDCVIVRWRILADVSGSIVVDIWKDTYANYPPTVADTITASAKPTLSSVIKNESTTLTGWTTALSFGDVLEFNIDSVTTVTKAYIDLFVRLR